VWLGVVSFVLGTAPFELLWNCKACGIYQMTQPRWAPERQRISPNEDYELRYWSERFDVPRDEIEAAVKRVGTRVEDVAHELSRHVYA
jgi:Protein of unknown function (DUF3606)